VAPEPLALAVAFRETQAFSGIAVKRPGLLNKSAFWQEGWLGVRSFRSSLGSRDQPTPQRSDQALQILNDGAQIGLNLDL
jgi:hypothetical protein